MGWGINLQAYSEEDIRVGLDPYSGGLIGSIDSYEHYLLQTVPFTTAEMQRVRDLCSEERWAVRESLFGTKEFNLTAERRRIAILRRDISRVARRRGAGL